MSDASTNVPSFSRSDIRLLVSGYTRVGLRQWGQIEIFAQVLGQGPMNDRSLAVIAWELNELTGNVVCVVDPCSTAPWFLRVVITPDFVFLGLYWAGVDSIASLADYDRFLVDAFCYRPLITGAIACHSLNNQEWFDLLCGLNTHLGSQVGSIGRLPPSAPIIPAAPLMPAATATIIPAAVPSIPVATVATTFPSVMPAICAGDLPMKDVGKKASEDGVGGPALPQIVTKDGRVITPQWTAIFPPPPPGVPRK
ncbi:hypothetical protein PMG11_08269 [Penicillium brasilianum]|uniref:Uncharacterized protein n=1 Tax=Penicillium brasilianum TaxID=104259 RepID=A0A0F7TS96_PENBI|nr:hypothetical protein PMG11_08269 [Penicillium brasilianum]